MWTGCGQRAVYTTHEHGGLADWATTEFVAPLDSLSLSFSFQWLNVSLSGMCSTHTVLGLHTLNVALLCHVPQGPGVDYSKGVIITRLLPDSTRYYCQFDLPSDTKRDGTCSKYSVSYVANRSSTQSTNSIRLRCSAAHLWLQHLSGVTSHSGKVLLVDPTGICRTF